MVNLAVNASSYFAFKGIKVIGVKTTSTPFLTSVADQGASWPSSNIVFSNMTLSSSDNVAGWTQAQWVANARTGFWVHAVNSANTTRCVSMTGSHIYNVASGIGLFAPNTLVSNNQIDHFGDDGIDFIASNLIITKNYIHDNLNIGNGNHEDAMQGFVGPYLRGYGSILPTS